VKKEYLKHLNERSHGAHFVWLGRINVYNAKDLADGINIGEVLEDVEEALPPEFLSNIESIYIGKFKELDRRHLSAVYDNGAIYISSEDVVNEDDLVDDIIHEIAHSLEETRAIDIYGDGQLEREFIIKRLQLFAALKDEEVPFFPRDYFINTEYSEEFDQYLYKEVGYPLLASLTTGLFMSPYGATSLREYFANAFEKYFLGAHEEVKSVSPQAYKKIKNLTEEEEEEYGNF